MRIIIICLLLLCSSYAKVLSLNEAFKTSFLSDKNGVSIDFDLAHKIHLYKDQLKITLAGKDITQLLNYPASIRYQGKESFVNKLELFIPSPLIKDSLQGALKARLDVAFQGCSTDGFCYLPTVNKYDLELKNSVYLISKASKKSKKSEEIQILSDMKNKNLFINLASFFFYGLLLAFTPCILPMIPILSSLIASKMQEGKKQVFKISFIYVFFMSLAYAIIGVIASFIGFNIQGLLQTPAVLISFSALFVILSASMFGLFSLELPLSFQNYIAKKSQGSGLIGVASMGFLSALIVGPCIAPPLAGALLYITQTHDVVFGAASLFVMSFGMGMPLLFIGLGGKLLKPGPWMQELKFFFGFLMLIMAIWLLSRLYPAVYINAAYGLVGIFFVVFMGLFTDKSSLFLLFKKGVLLCVLSLAMFAFVQPFLPILGIKYTQTASSKLEFEKKISSNKELDKLLEKEKRDIILYYTASWCTSCKLLKPYFEKADLSSYQFYVVDLSDNSKEDLALMKRFFIFGPPALVFFKNQKQSSELAGFEAIRDFLLDLKRP